LEEQKVKAEDDIRASEEDIAELREELKELQETLEEKSKIVDQVKKTTLKASKVLDQALKEIAVCVRFIVVQAVNHSFPDIVVLIFRMMKLRNLPLNDQLYIGNVVWKKFNCHCLQVI
jgi:cell division septum initiation protein DivIVA